MNLKGNREIFRKFYDLVKRNGAVAALDSPIEESTSDPLEIAIFGPQDKTSQRSETTALAGLTFGDLIYELSSVDPHVIRALDFSRKQEIDGPFDYAAYVKNKVDSSGSVSVSEFSNMKGYVAEQYVATKLQSQGYEVELPETSNASGFDLFVDGEMMQVKCGASVGLLKDHFEKYPNIPVLANSELVEKAIASGQGWASKVFAVEGYNLDVVEDITSSSIDAGVEAFDYEIPMFVAGVCAARNAYSWWKGSISLGDALATAALEIGAKVPLAGVGAIAGQGVGLLLFGPAGGVVFGGVMAVASASQSRRLIALLKKWLNKEAAENLRRSATRLLKVLSVGLSKKALSLEKKMGKLPTEGELGGYLKTRFVEDKKYFEERQREISSISKKVFEDPTELAIKTIDILRRSKVHPALYQEELKDLLKFFEEAKKAIKGWPKFS